jgi:hypothetical protein
MFVQSLSGKTDRLYIKWLKKGVFSHPTPTDDIQIFHISDALKCSRSPAGPNQPPIADPVISMGRKASPYWSCVSLHSFGGVAAVEQPLFGIEATLRLQ